jgi:biopolymer transport protein ExbD
MTVNFQVPLLFVLIVLQPDYSNSGLPVRVYRAEKTSQPIPGLEPVLVRIHFKAGDSRPELYINSQLVPWDNFEENLQKALSRCPPEWPVYVEGDPDLDWGAVVNVLDRIRGLHVPVTMLTNRRAFAKSK